MNKLRILVAEDNPDIAENIGDYLAIYGHQIDYAYDGNMAVALVEQCNYDVVVMDILMPKMNGVQATQQIRTMPNGGIPILMLTAKDTLDEKLIGFDAGADDYIVKPFDMKELHARILAQARKALKNYHHQLTVNGIVLNQRNLTASINANELQLNPTTFKIMWYLTKAYPDLVEKQELENFLWGEDRPEKDILRSHIYNLRKSIACCDQYVSILSKHGKGYQLITSRE